MIGPSASARPASHRGVQTTTSKDSSPGRSAGPVITCTRTPTSRTSLGASTPGQRQDCGTALPPPSRQVPDVEVAVGLPQSGPEALFKVRLPPVKVWLMTWRSELS